MNRKAIGKLGEDKAVDYLKDRGYNILATNWQNKWGEIDIVASPPRQKFWQKDKIVFCEVKTIRQKAGFMPEDEINQKKERQLLKMAQIYLSANKIPLNTPHQIDILAVEINPFDNTHKTRHTENAIEDTYWPWPMRYFLLS